MQAAIFRPIILFIAAVLWTNGTYTPGQVTSFTCVDYRYDGGRWGGGGGRRYCFVCLSVHTSTGGGGGNPHLRSGWGGGYPILLMGGAGGYPIPGPDRGSTPSQVWTGGVPHPADGGIPPSKIRTGGTPPPIKT